MTALASVHFGPGRLARLGRFVLNGVVGSLLCSGPVTAILALGWLTRWSGHRSRDRFGRAAEGPGWLMGPRELQGRPTSSLVRAVGGLAANVRAGIMALTALLAWTLPFALLWLGAWWAGWENSFNKGYEQAAIGPITFLTGWFVAAPVLPALPLILAHLAAEDRLGAAFELRRLRSLIAQAGWRIPALSVVTAVLALPFLAARGLITLAPSVWPGIEDMGPEAIAEIQGRIALGLAALAFLSAWIIRWLASAIYLRAAPRAAGLKPGLWDGAEAAEAATPARPASHLITALMYGAAMVITVGLAFLILAGQFLDHAWWRWIFHPALTLPWAG
ncbi:MAG: hypothetical protein JNN02_02475 [Tabrizicola sp.]|nr:hypothetical protein [Tabrizicola sp.]